MDWQKMEVVFLIDPLGTYNFFINERDQSLPQLSIRRGWLPLSPQAHLLNYWQFVLIFILDIQVWKQPLGATYISPNKLLFSSDFKVKDGGRTASFQH